MNLFHNVTQAAPALFDVQEGRFGGRAAPAHMHCALEVGVVISGEVRLGYPRFCATLRPGQVWWAGCWETHAALPLKGGTLAAGFVFQPEALASDPLGEIDWLAPFLAAPARRPQLTEREDREAAVRIGHTALRLVRKRSKGWRTTAWVDLHRLVCLAYRGWNPPRGGRYRTHAARVVPAMKLVNDRLPRPVRLDEAARACAMSRCRFATVFASATGVSFAKFALRTRLACAADALLSGNESLQTLAGRWGFTDASHFHRVFTRHYGSTPGQFRARRAPASGVPA